MTRNICAAAGATLGFSIMAVPAFVILERLDVPFDLPIIAYMAFLGGVVGAQMRDKGDDK